LATDASEIATLNVGNISHHTFNMDALYCVKSHDLVKTNAHGTLCWNKRQFATRLAPNWTS